jgi:hypothetical protein
MFETIKKLPIVNFAIIKIQKSFIDLLFVDRVSVIDTIFVFFDRGSLDNDIAGETEISEKVEQF